jgi:hypothetical protein
MCRTFAPPFTPKAYAQLYPAGNTEDDQKRNADLFCSYNYSKYTEAITGYNGQDLQRVGFVKWDPAIRTRIGECGDYKAGFMAIGVNPDGQREILGVSVSLSKAEVHWRDFLTSLLSRGLHGVLLIVSDANLGLRAARECLFNGVKWQRCQFHLQQNAHAYVPKKSMQEQVHEDIKDIFAALDGKMS